MTNEQVNNMVEEIVDLRLEMTIRLNGVYEGKCPYGLSQMNDEVCVPFDECSECRNYWMQEQRKTIQRCVMEKYGINQEDD